MPATIQHDRDNIFRVDLHGAVPRTELERCREQVQQEIDRVGAVRLLFDLDGFDGWDRDASWKDVFVYVGRGDRIERIAIVGLERWQQTWTFSVADMYRARVEFFPEAEVAEARTWLTL
jgi:hypothetical protein